MPQIIEIARNQSIQAKQTETTRENRYWQYQTYRSNYKPQLRLDGVFPGYNRSFDEVRQPDGSYEFKPIVINNSELNLSLRQSIGRTGTMVFLNSGINRFDNFKDQYSLDELTETENNLKNLFKQLGELVLRFKSKGSKLSSLTDALQ